MRISMAICGVLAMVLTATSVANAGIMYADEVTTIDRGDTSIGNYAGFYGGTYPGSFPVELTEEQAKVAILGPPDTSFLSLPGGVPVTGATFSYAYVQVEFPQPFYATGVSLYITELGANQESAQLWLWASGGGNIQPDIQRNGDDTIVVFTSDHGEMFQKGVSGHSTPLVFEPGVRVPLGPELTLEDGNFASPDRLNEDSEYRSRCVGVRP